MKTQLIQVNLNRRRRTLLAGLSILGLCAAHTQLPAKAPPVFMEIPGVTAPLAAPAKSARRSIIESEMRLADAASSVESPIATAPPAAAAPQKQLYSFTANDLELKMALAQFARANNLNIVPDHDVLGTVTLDVRDLPLEQMLRALLDASDCSWSQDGGLIRVRNAETRTFTVDYLRLARKGHGTSSATLNSATSGGSGGGGSGGGSSGGGSGGSGSSGNSSSSSVNLNSDNSTDFWEELRKELSVMLTDQGLKSFAINKTAGLISVSDRPSVLKKIEHYLNATEESIHREVDIEVKIYDVTLNDQFQFGIDWNVVAKYYEDSTGFGSLGAVGSTVPIAIGGGKLQNSALALLFTNFAGNIPVASGAAIQALKTQGNVEVIAKPRIRIQNNQTALIKVGQEQPFFSQTTINSQSAGGNQTSSGDIVTTITVGTILSITPQISGDGWISMDISPVLTSLVGVLTSPSKTATAPILDTKQSSTLVRVRDGTTVVMGGLIQTERSKNETKIPLLGDIPWLGKVLFTGHFNFKQKKELVMFVTPRIVREGAEPPLPVLPAEDEFKPLNSINR